MGDMQIFFDTNIVVKESFFRSSTAHSFLKTARFLNLNVVIPQVVIDEVHGKYPDFIRVRHDKFEKAAKELNYLLEQPISTKVDLVSEETRFLSWLNETIRSTNIKVIPYPNVELRTIVTNSYKSRKPFKPSGEGYKDFLIWESIASYINDLECEDDEFYFLTNNISDFCSKSDEKIVLHHHLQETILKEKNRIAVYVDLAQFFSEKILPLLTGVELSRIPGLSLDQLKKIAKEQIEDELQYYSAYGIEGLEFSNEVTITGVHSVRFDDWDILEISEGFLLIFFDGVIEIEVDGFVDKRDYYSKDYEKLSIVDANWNEWVIAVNQTIETPFRLLMSYSKADRKITDHSITLVQELTNNMK